MVFSGKKKIARKSHCCLHSHHQEQRTREPSFGLVTHLIHSSLSPQHEILCVSACCFFIGKMYCDIHIQKCPLFLKAPNTQHTMFELSHKLPIQRLSSTMNLSYNLLLKWSMVPHAVASSPSPQKANPALLITGVFLKTTDQDGDSPSGFSWRNHCFGMEHSTLYLDEHFISLVFLLIQGVNWTWLGCKFNLNCALIFP